MYLSLSATRFLVMLLAFFCKDWLSVREDDVRVIVCVYYVLVTLLGDFPAFVMFNYLLKMMPTRCHSCRLKMEKWRYRNIWTPADAYCNFQKRDKR